MNLSIRRKFFLKNSTFDRFVLCGSRDGEKLAATAHGLRVEVDILLVGDHVVGHCLHPSEAFQGQHVDGHVGGQQISIGQRFWASHVYPATYRMNADRGQRLPKVQVAETTNG